MRLLRWIRTLRRAFDEDRRAWPALDRGLYATPRITGDRARMLEADLAAGHVPPINVAVPPRHFAIPSFEDPTAFPFVDAVAGSTVTLHMGDEPGVSHAPCPYRAEVCPDLDAFFCRYCGRNGRISGAWFLELLNARQ